MREKVMDMIKKNGFLIVLFICVCVVGASTIFISTRELFGKEDSLKKKQEMVILNEQRELQVDRPSDVDSLEGIIQGETSSEQIPKVEDIGELEVEENSVVESEEYSQGEVMEVFKEGEIEFVDDNKDEEIYVAKAAIMPVEGEIIQEHSNDSLIYSETLGEWRAHLGIDIKSPIGTKVKAALDGQVKRAYEDRLWGNTIILDHGNGLETKYANLNTLEMVKEGVKVKQGEYISGIGKSADIEMMLEEHLHYEVIKHGKRIDPRSIMD